MSEEGIINNAKCSREIQSKYRKKRHCFTFLKSSFVAHSFLLRYVKCVFIIYMFSFLIAKYKKVKGRKITYSKDIFNMQRLKKH